MSTRPIIHSTVACVIRRDDRFLLVEEYRGDAHSVFNQPAGHIEPGEGPMAAALREAAEETAWQVRLEAYLGLYVLHTPSGLTFHSHGFVATAQAPLTRAIDPDIHAVHWLSKAEIDALNDAGRLRSPLVLERIDDALAGRHYPLAVLHERP
ncbi:NUDIX domain-containing protein [Halomonas dongshanensis]|uniref:NUDIX domain-containing protein n=1 Tax=Halomonas dongshanensis TaxID=2890835 RepID=A0ABT2EBX9_9GAMM|nr:NUDIX domain-containing protein [Halomonas dongshanensis]MCS2609086.1 NUDIX domain-containing protein [Halomonas dongshanensis]